MNTIQSVKCKSSTGRRKQFRTQRFHLFFTLVFNRACTPHKATCLARESIGVKRNKWVQCQNQTEERYIVISLSTKGSRSAPDNRERTLYLWRDIFQFILYMLKWILIFCWGLPSITDKVFRSRFKVWCSSSKWVLYFSRNTQE